jgi:hypothetical protein
LLLDGQSKLAGLFNLSLDKVVQTEAKQSDALGERV